MSYAPATCNGFGVAEIVRRTKQAGYLGDLRRVQQKIKKRPRLLRGQFWMSFGPVTQGSTQSPSYCTAEPWRFESCSKTLYGNARPGDPTIPGRQPIAVAAF